MTSPSAGHETPLSLFKLNVSRKQDFLFVLVIVADIFLDVQPADVVNVQNDGTTAGPSYDRESEKHRILVKNEYRVVLLMYGPFSAIDLVGCRKKYE
mmetsp:Transcript_28317/g.53217  ORF Transcript_28317/g.53217 Transcript_28317/m.53217 type:complete len:97 (+) Transcript_28317:304-594(+)